jgi:hypothetical protein
MLWQQFPQLLLCWHTTLVRVSAMCLSCIDPYTTCLSPCCADRTQIAMVLSDSHQVVLEETVDCDSGSDIGDSRNPAN